MYNPFSLTGKTVLVSGASSGIGKAIAIECSKMGARVIITGRNEERLEETYRFLEGNDHKFIVADLSLEEDLILLAEQLPILDGVVHSAGTNSLQPFQFIEKKHVDAIFSINFTGPILLSQKALRLRKLNKGASIVFISSISGVFCSSVGSSLYSSTKGAINGVVKGMALDLASKGIRVNSINPGVVETNIFSHGMLTEEQLSIEMKRYPLKRYGRPDEIAHACIYLLSNASAWVTGTNLVIDGGYLLL